MKTFKGKPPTLLPERAQRWNRLKPNLGSTPFVTFLEGKSKALPSLADFWLPTKRTVKATLLGPDSPESLRQSTACVTTVAREQAAPPQPPPKQGAWYRHDSRSRRPTPFKPQPPVTFFINAPQQPGFPGPPGASRVPADPAGPGSPGPRLQQDRYAGVVLPLRKQSTSNAYPGTACPGTSPPRPGCG